MIRLSGRLFCCDEREARLVSQHLAEHIRLSRAEPGCLAFEVTPQDNGRIWLVEECFADKRAFEAHQARTGASTWGRATAGIRREYRTFGDDPDLSAPP